MTFGPVQVLVLGFEGINFQGKILAELTRLREADIVRLVDLVVVAKDEDGDLATLKTSDLSDEESAELGAIAGALIGLGAEGADGAEMGAAVGADVGAAASLDDDEVWYAADAIPPGTAAAVALIEHRWAIPLRDAIAEAGGFTLEDTWLHPRDLVALGMAAAE